MYNKNTEGLVKRNGTLMENWWEEQVLREGTGVGRYSLVFNLQS